MRWPMLCGVLLLLGGTLVFSQEPSTAPQASDSPAQNLASAPQSEKSSAVEPANDARAEHSQKEDSGKHKLHFRLGGVAVGAGYSHFSGPFYPYSYPYAYAPYGWYPGDWVSASLWYPVWGSSPFYGPEHFSYNNGRGEVRLTADPKDARVYIDGGYAGTADKLKNLWLDPGAYDLTVSATGREDFHERVYVLSGKSLKIAARLSVGETKEKP